MPRNEVLTGDKRTTAPKRQQRQAQARTAPGRRLTVMAEARRETAAEALGDDRLGVATYEQLYLLSAVPTLVIDHHHRRVERANDAALRFLGLATDAVVGRPGPELLLQPSPERLTRVRALRGDETAAIREVPTALGVHTVQIDIVPSGTEGIAFVQLTDLTELLDAAERAEARAEELASTSKALKTIATRLAHDVCGPIAAVAGFADLMLRPDSSFDEEERASLLQRISRNTHALSSMTTSILSQADSGRTLPEDASQDVEALFHLVRTIVDAQLVECDGMLHTTSTTPALPVPVGTIRQAVINLVSNSIKYRDPARPLVVTIEVHDTDAGTEIRVRDNGTGLPDDPTRLFQAGERGPAATGTSGSGLGLAFARAAVESVGGTLSATPAAAGAAGAELVIVLPRSDEQAAGDTPDAPSIDAGLTAPQLERILDASPVPSFVIDIAIRQIVRVNRAAIELLGVDDSQIFGRPGSDFVDEGDVLEALRRRVIDEPDAHTGLRTNLRTASGPVPVLVWIAPVPGTALAMAQAVVVDPLRS